MTGKIRRIDFSPDEWIAGTLGMTLEEEGLYIRICVLIWSRGERITYELLKGACGSTHGNKINAILRQLEVAGKITRNGSEIGQKRAENELENARKRVGKAQENGAKGGRPNGLEKPDGYVRRKANHQLSTGKEERFSHKELNLSVLTPREATPPLPSQGDGVAASRSTPVEPAAPTAPDPPTKEEGAAAFKRCIDAINGKLGVLDSGATVPPPPDPRLVEFRDRLSRLNTLAGTKLRGELRMQAWEVLAAADSLADPHALSPAMLADLDAIERLGQPEQWAEAAE